MIRPDAKPGKRGRASPVPTFATPLFARVRLRSQPAKESPAWAGSGYLQVTRIFTGYVAPTVTFELRHVSRIPVTRNFGRYCGSAGFQQMIVALTL